MFRLSSLIAAAAFAVAAYAAPLDAASDDTSVSTASGSVPGAPIVGKCGKTEVLFTGYPPYHPDVIRQGWDPAQVDAGLKAELAALVGAGYNTKELFTGPELGMAPIIKALKSKKWDLVLIGFGVRGDPALNSTIHFEQEVNVVKELAGQAKFAFNYSPTSSLEAVTRMAPMAKKCTSPGKNYGEEIICPICPPGHQS